ncbi:MAG: hypothetical protein HWE27_18080 [Gammaproteobacteria bacterium]|nr:hypothetical protein [Gammaproteobacteria bacterium]
MVDGIFDIVFAGRTAPNKSQEEVKAGLAKLFKTNEAQIERLFSGTEVTVKKGLNYAQAMKYQSALKQVGALVLIKKQEVSTGPKSPETQTPVPKPPEHEKVAAQSASSAINSAPAQPSTSQQTAQTNNSQSDSEEDGDWGVAAAGEKLPEQAKKAPIAPPDLSGLSLGNAGENLVEAKGRPKAEVDTSSLSLSEPAPLPKSKPVPAKEVDVSALSMAEAGEKIPVEKQNKEPVNPNIDHLEISK